METNNLSDREIDALIAEKVMGLVPCQGVGHANGELLPCHAQPDSPTQGSETRCYSTDISAAWEVVEKMSCTTKEYWTLEAFSTGCIATFDYEGGRDLPWTIGEHVGEDEDLARAICKAALAAV